MGALSPEVLAAIEQEAAAAPEWSDETRSRLRLIMWGSSASVAIPGEAA